MKFGSHAFRNQDILHSFDSFNCPLTSSVVDYSPKFHFTELAENLKVKFGGQIYIFQEVLPISKLSFSTFIYIL